MAVNKFPVEGSHIMMFARSIADDNQIYYDEDYAGTTEPGRVIAPPTFAQSSAQFDPDYFLRPKIGEDWFGFGGSNDSLAHHVLHTPKRAFSVVTNIGGFGDSDRALFTRGARTENLIVFGCLIASRAFTDDLSVFFEFN